MRDPAQPDIFANCKFKVEQFFASTYWIRVFNSDNREVAEIKVCDATQNELESKKIADHIIECLTKGITDDDR